MEENKMFKLSKKQQNYILWFHKITIFLSIGLYFSFLLAFAIIPLSQIGNFFKINNPTNLSSIRTFFIAICAFGLIFSIFYTISSWLCSYEEYLNYKIQFIVLNIISLTILNFILNIIIYSFETKKSSLMFQNKTRTKRFLLNLGIWKWKTFDFVIIAMFCALTLALSYVETNILPSLPNGGGIALKYIPLIIIAFLHSTLAGVVTGAISALMSLLFVQSGFIISPWSYLLDYFLPMITPSLAGLMRFKINNDKKYITYVNYIVICVTVTGIIYFWQVLSGYFIWTTLFPDSIWPGYSSWLYSIVYNFIQVFIFTYPLVQLIIPIALRSLAPIFWKRYLKY